MLTKKIGTYRGIIEENTEEINDYNYIDVDYVTDLLDEIEGKLGETGDLADVPDSVDAALDGAIGIMAAIGEYVVGEEVPAKLANLIVEITKHVSGINDSLREILQAVENANDTLSDLSDDLF